MLNTTKYGPRVALYGLGGVGKSQIAIEYAYRLRETSPHVSIFWVFASNPARFRASYQAIAKELCIPGLDDPHADPLDLVHRWLLNERSGEWLLILDNADDINFIRPGHEALHDYAYDFSIAQFLPQRAGGTILITSRYHAAASTLASRTECVILVTAMTEAEATLMIERKIAGHLGTAVERQPLARLLDYIPLAITQAAAYITTRQRMSIAKYLRLFESTQAASVMMLTEEGGDLRRDPDVSNAVMRTWEISFVQIQSQNALSIALLSFMAVLERQGVPEFLLRGNHAEIEFDAALEVLLGYAFVTEGQHGTTFGMHRLVQLATREWLKSQGHLLRQHEAAVKVFDHIYPGGDYEDWERCQTLEPHASVGLLEQYNSDELELALARIWMRRANYLTHQGQYVLAEKLNRCALDKKTRILGEEHCDTLTSMNHLVSVYHEQGRFAEAEKLEAHVLRVQQRVLGPEHRDTLTSMSQLASIYHEQGWFAEAEKLGEQVLRLRRSLLGEEDHEISVSMTQLAATYSQQGQFAKAEKLEEQVLRVQRKLLGDEHPDTLQSMSNLAITFWEQGRGSEAEKMEAQALQVRKKLVGEEHPSTLLCMNNLAFMLWQRGQVGTAEGMFRGALAGQERMLGHDHPRTLNSVSNLAALLWETEMYDESRALYERAITGFEMRLGHEHPDTKTCRAEFDAKTKQIICSKSSPPRVQAE